jgi:TolB protein
MTHPAVRSATVSVAIAGLGALVFGVGATPARVSDSGEVTNIYVVPVGGGRAVRVTNNRESNEETFAYYPSWSPDGRRIVFSEAPCDGCPPEIHIIRAKPTRGKNWLGAPIGFGLYPRWAPNGKLIAFVGPKHGIYAMRTDGSHRRLIAKGGLGEDGPSWSPDSKRIVFARQETATQWRLHVVGVDGRGLRPLTSGRVPALNPSWSPTGRRIAFAQELGRWQILTITLDGKSRTRVSNGRASDTFPVWAPDGRRLAFVRQIGSATAVYSVAATGRGVRRVSPRSLVGFQPAWSPNGRQIAFAGAPK